MPIVSHPLPLISHPVMIPGLMSYSFEFGTLTSGGNPACRLFSVAAASVPAPTSGQSFVVYDVGCSV
jgi:hypothetical protein